MTRIGKFVRENGLSLAFAGLFLASAAADAATGYLQQFGGPSTQPRAAGLGAYLASPEFLRGVLGNWQAALLQLLVLIVLAVFLRQRGASHSRKGDDRLARRRDRLRWFGRHESWAYANSLSLAFGALFLLCFAGFFAADLAYVGREQARLGAPAPRAPDFIRSARFWFDVTQTWQAEFFAMAVFLVLSIFLRQQDSSESKPVSAGDEDTGDANE